MPPFAAPALHSSARAPQILYAQITLAPKVCILRLSALHYRSSTSARDKPVNASIKTENYTENYMG